MAMVSLSCLVGATDCNLGHMIPDDQAFPFIVSDIAYKHIPYLQLKKLFTLMNRKMTPRRLINLCPYITSPEWWVYENCTLMYGAFIDQPRKIYGWHPIWGFDLKPWLCAQTPDFRAKLAAKAFAQYDKDGSTAKRFCDQFNTRLNAQP